ncbi:phytanoyl-CoA dioxygenase family protein [Oceanibacterium hippocampi]|uniref:Phytanoyl-CoA dioxygenase (PhyH) n=1 Tax=Oceanibacterium hippocampi TaxID=745714 RepID=A0A1Y5TLH5_9PROT|nr:phytanoyl-CoA dioxygenase family protein [Oceanibacterium hippocampi]SLN66828.1 Phytanoyl-CoA dioxygenase (PhyH) [Oceanibacterium hippocampi]
MNKKPIRAITEQEIAAYREDGVVCLRKMFDAEWVEYLREAIQKDIARPGKLKRDVNRGGTGEFFSDTFVWKNIEDFEAFIFDSPSGEIAASLFGAEKVNMLFDQILIKEPGTSTGTLWHHDATYWPIKGHQVCTLWLALDNVSLANGAVEYVKGSHLWNHRYRPESFTGEATYQGQDLPGVPDVESMRDTLDIVHFDLEPGDCTIHHGLTLHGAPGNTSSSLRRRAYVSRWCGDDIVYDPRPNIQKMLYDPDIQPGGPLDCELFPVVWPDSAQSPRTSAVD